MPGTCTVADACPLAGIGLRRPAAAAPPWAVAARCANIGGLLDRTCSVTDMLDFESCNAARLARDPAFDGRFFIGVRTTRIYCRPVCPVRPARTENVRFFPSATAAELAGFRPCLRCRPETAPFSPAWNGSRATVDRALRLIADGALDERPVERLADDLGVGARHLGRLFRKHLGATPTQVARTVRVQRAKRLLSETDLAMTEIAYRAGFRSLRRFNAVFAEVYRRKPTEIRRSRPRRSEDQPDGAVPETTLVVPKAEQAAAFLGG